MIWWEVSGDIAARPRKGDESLGPVSDMIDNLGEMPPNFLSHRFPLLTSELERVS